MYNFRIGFQYPWLLLLLIPALFFTLFHYFRSAKKYRRNRNRVTSMVLHILVMVLAVSVFSGLNFLYEIPNTDNQIVLLVDMSDSGDTASDKRDEIVRDVLDESRSRYSVGVVMFGYDQVLAYPLGTDIEEAYDRYLNSALPDTTATDIASAMQYTKNLFTNPETAKIVLISDGLETDGDAVSAVRSVAAEGIRVDTVSITRSETDEVEVVNIQVPDYNVVVGDPFKLTVTLKSTIESDAKITLYDNNEVGAELSGYLTKGAQDVTIEYTFNTPGMHELSIGITNGDDTVAENNTYYTYIKIAVFDRVLVIERNVGESDNVVRMIKDGTDYTVDVLHIKNDKDRLPQTVNDFRMYDEVVLVNIARKDMPEGFEDNLDSYVKNYGGGLFTVGGNDDSGEANTYDRDDMEGTIYQQMLPVQAINYTPPIAVAFLLDVSGSMATAGSIGTSDTKLDLAKKAIASCIQFSLTERDYAGIYTLGDPAEELCQILPVPQMARIIASLNRDDFNSNGTPYASSIDKAGTLLNAITMVEKRHIVIVSDGDPTDNAENSIDSNGNKVEGYLETIKRYHDNGVTVTIVNIGQESKHDDKLEQAASLGGGRYIKISNINDLTLKMRKELEADEIKKVNYETFTPRIREHTSVVSGLTQDDIPTLDGFYGTKIKEGATSVLVGEYVPVYAQWKYGEGSVGSFMCDLNGTWSENFISSEHGTLIVKNIIAALFPTKDIRPSEIDVSLKCGNYSTVMSIFTDVNEGETIEASYKSKGSSGEETTKIEMDPSNGYSRATFVITAPGIHEVDVRKLNANGEVVAKTTLYRVFSYSAEYDVLTDKDGAEFMADLAAKGKGTAITEYWQVYEGFEEAIHKNYDPRLIFCIIALVLFLLDIAVRKFKFKWIHEIIRDRKENKYRRG